MAKTATKQSEQDILRAAMERVQGDTAGAGQTVAPETPEPQIEKESAPPAPTRKRAAAPTSPPTETETKAAGKKVHKVTYTPLDDGDSPFTMFFGMKFSANLPRDVTNEECVALARNNPWFTVDGKPGPKRSRPGPREIDLEEARSGLPINPKTGEPYDPDKYEIEASELIEREG